MEPYRLVNDRRRWYLVAWDTGRDDWRTFRVDRIEPKTPAGPRFTPRALPSDEEIAPEWDAFLAALGRPASQNRIKALMARGFHRAGDVENRLGFYVGQLGGG